MAMPKKLINTNGKFLMILDFYGFHCPKIAGSGPPKKRGLTELSNAVDELHRVRGPRVKCPVPTRLGAD